jgi:hypothetical protein
VRASLCSARKPASIARRDDDAGRETKNAARIRARDSLKNPPLASGDETRSRWARKFFYCQNPRLRVRATGILPASAGRNDIARASIGECVNKKRPVAQAFSAIKHSPQQPFHSHFALSAHTSSCCWCMRIARARLDTSTLP